MQVEVKLFTLLRKGREKQYLLDFPEDASVFTVLQKLQIEPDLVNIVLINGIVSEKCVCLHDGDCVSLFPAIGGG